MIPQNLWLSQKACGVFAVWFTLEVRVEWSAFYNVTEPRHIGMLLQSRDALHINIRRSGFRAEAKKNFVKNYNVNISYF